MGGSPDLREAIRRAHRRGEVECVAALAAEVEALQGDVAAVAAQAGALVAAVRAERRDAPGIDRLMQEFSLSSQEGVALMCLAEALLRVPDTATADRLIRDKLGSGDWQSHLGHSGSLFVNAATWGLYITGRLVATHSERALGGALTRLLQRGGEPLIRRGVDFAMRLLGQQFVMGQTIAAALARSREAEGRGYRHSFDMLGEAALTAADAERYQQAYAEAIHAIGAAAAGRGVVAGPGISVKLSALHPRYARSQRERVMAELLPRLRDLARLARGYDLGLNIDAEESERLELSLDLLAALAEDAALAGWEGLGFVVQAYQKRAIHVVDWLADLARRQGRRLMVRLVKGAYWDSEIKRAQAEGQADYPVFTRKTHTDLSYLACAARLLAAADAVYPQFATHNAHTLAAVRQMAQERAVAAYEFQCLHGMGEALYDHVVGTAGLDLPCRIYAPVGSHETLLPYLVRRLLENGANTSFVHRLVDPAIAIDELVEEPLERLRREGGGPHPAIPLPAALYGAGRRNSAGADLADEATIATVAAAIEGVAQASWQALPRVAGAVQPGAGVQEVRNPANRDDIVGQWRESDPAAVAAALSAAHAGAAAWHATPPARRAELLLRAADGLEADRLTLAGLCVREAGKTWGNALAEVREAVDFCRYYAQRLLAGDLDGVAEAPGPAACISPWNFPLAIFIGQVSAALAAGSPVLAKPAEQTPLVAARAVELLLAAGIPPAALHFLPGAGETVGAVLTADPRVRSVVFTGSTAVARGIARALAGRPGTRLIAETGGQNAMIADSSALPEQVVQDVLTSAFDSAGQRCSALRVLCLHDAVADRVLAMLRAALGELAIGDPARLATDFGPVIDAAARDALLTHIEGMRARGRPVFQVPLPAGCDAGTFVPPTVIGIDALQELAGEVFGPVLHVLRFAAPDLPAVVEAINGTGYGLTLGIHSRIDETIAAVVDRARVGNIYVNRNMIGAVVGVQPFGGERLSGTGPKAGGPLMLHRLAGSGCVGPAAVGARLEKRDGGLLPVLAAWAAGNGRAALAQHCAACGERSLLGAVVDLPGPTGERNTLGFAPRGAMLCLGRDEAELLAQLAAVLATGNTAIWEKGPRTLALAGGLPATVAAAVGFVESGQWGGIAGVLAEPDIAAARDVRRRLAAGEGALIPILEPGPGGLYPLQELLAERTLTVNTAAAGGNAALMSLGP